VGQSKGLDFTAAMRRLCGAMAERLPDLNHVAIDRVAFRVCQTRKPVSHGMYASLTPLRFAGGERVTQRRNRLWTIAPLFDAAGREFLYLLSFYLPRFCDQSLDEKLSTVMHELWHIGPAFDGDLRRLPGRCYAHGSSEAEFHNAARAAARRWLSLSPSPELYAFLDGDFRQLCQRHGGVYGARIRTPKLVPAPPNLPELRSIHLGANPR
jgi:predicted metallopeptidase